MDNGPPICITLVAAVANSVQETSVIQPTNTRNTGLEDDMHRHVIATSIMSVMQDPDRAQ